MKEFTYIEIVDEIKETFRTWKKMPKKTIEQHLELAIIGQNAMYPYGKKAMPYIIKREAMICGLQLALETKK